MELKRRKLLVYGLLAAIWVLVLGWQVVEHARVRASERQARLTNHARDIANTLGVVIRSQRWRGRVIKERIESTLNSLVNPDDLTAIALLNDAGDIIASSGPLADANSPADTTIILTNLVELSGYELQQTNPTVVVVPLNEITNRPPATNEVETTNSFAGATSAPPATAGGERPHSRGRRLPPISESEIEAQGVHSFALALSTQAFRAACEQDLWMRGILMALATVSLIGFGVAWGSLGESADLQIRLVRASEMNAHLKEMNLAAAGLAHETRNPLNIIRGLAHMLAKQTDASAEVRENSRAILEETDKVTAQLTEFINYSRPREVRRSVLALNQVINEVTHTLQHDLDEKHIKLELTGDAVSIEADEQMFRQVLFNLVLNAIQAVGDGGRIQVAVNRRHATEASLEVRDNGPGVPAEQRAEIFTPYFTTRPKGTGLGLAVVHQIVLAHGWEIQCLPNTPTGAVFRISHLKVAG